MSPVLQTEFPFALPRGYVDADGTLHREGTMRLATAGDEILPLKDPRVQGNPSYLVVIVLSRVITRLGTLDDVNPRIIEGLFATDFAFLQDLYNRINDDGSTRIQTTCPKCEHQYEIEANGLGGGLNRYPTEVLYREISFVAYHYHWELETILGLDHRERRRWVEEISWLNRTLNEEAGR